MIIGLLGIDFDSTNMGCEALGYGFLQILHQVANENSNTYDVIVFEKCDLEKLNIGKLYPNIRLSSIALPKLRSKNGIKDHKLLFNKCDIIFDFTAGDSFSDIYGLKRFIRRTFVKILAIEANPPFVLGSQTYGPYKCLISKVMAKFVFRKSYLVFARDRVSADIVKKYSGIIPIQTVDVAFAMPYSRLEKNSDNKIAGFNPSGLLWNGGYNGRNQFGLKVDYKDYCKRVIGLLLMQGYKVKLISHVLSEDMLQTDNDLVAATILHQEFPDTELAPRFDNAIEAKSYISGLDVFIGARMHATIAAISTLVPVLPFSYSRKFEGLFSSIGYEHIISGTKITTEEAIQLTSTFLRDISNIKESMNIYIKRIEQGTEALVAETSKAILGALKND